MSDYLNDERRRAGGGHGYNCTCTGCIVNAKTCPAPLAYRDMSDIGSKRVCGNPAVTPAGFCRRHDPETKPKRDARGRILRKQPTRKVVDCYTCLDGGIPLRVVGRAPLTGLPFDDSKDHEGHDLRTVEVPR